jgi:hypothetical protein
MTEDATPAEKWVRAVFSIVVTVAVAIVAYYVLSYLIGGTPP